MRSFPTTAEARPDDLPDDDLRPVEPKVRWARTRRLAAFAERHPVLTVFTASLLVRLAVGAASMVATDHTVIPDEIQYLTLGDLAANHKLYSTLWLGYGRSLYHATATFMWPLTAIYWVLWPWRGFAIAMVALAGAATAACTAKLAMELLPRRWAIAAGMVVALVPSQVLWSSVVLRESFVWMLLAVVGLATTKVILGSRHVVPLLGAALAACVGLGYLRQQTMIVAAWAVAGAIVVAVGRDRRIRLGAAGIGIALLAPFLSGYGPGGWDLLVKAIPSLGSTRAYLSMNAESAFVPTTIAGVVTTTTTVPAGVAGTGGGKGSGGSQGTGDHGSGAASIASRPPVSEDGTTRELVNTKTGDVYVVDTAFATNFSALPRGLVAVLFRPFPWDHTRTMPLAFARFEELVWYGLYALAAVGLWAERRRWRAMACPLLLLVGIVLVGAVTQGNLGTAFRHRGQILWAIAVPAACGLHHLVVRHRARRATGPVLSPG